MPKTRTSAHPIATTRQVRALASPMRQEIVDALETAGPLSAAEIGALLGRAPDSLYFHLRVLRKVGLVLERGDRKQGRHVAAVYDLPGRPLRIAYAPPVRADDVFAVVSAALRLSLRDFRRAQRAGDAVTSGGRRTLWGGRSKGWVREADVERVNALLEELQSILRGGRPGPGAEPVSLGFVLSPSPPTPRAAARARNGKPR